MDAGCLAMRVGRVLSVPGSASGVQWRVDLRVGGNAASRDGGQEWPTGLQLPGGEQHDQGFGGDGGDTKCAVPVPDVEGSVGRPVVRLRT